MRLHVLAAVVAPDFAGADFGKRFGRFPAKGFVAPSVFYNLQGGFGRSPATAGRDDHLPGGLQSLVDTLPDAGVQVAISFLSELGEQEVVDAETAAKLDMARAEPGDDIPLKEVRRRLGL